MKPKLTSRHWIAEGCRTSNTCYVKEVAGNGEGVFFYEETTDTIPAIPTPRARLIAAAPDMFKTLERTLIELSDDEHFERFKELYAAIDAALKKARGER